MYCTPKFCDQSIVIDSGRVTSQVPGADTHWPVALFEARPITLLAEQRPDTQAPVTLVEDAVTRAPLATLNGIKSSSVGWIRFELIVRGQYSLVPLVMLYLLLQQVQVIQEER
ncbi:hypothetical protein BCR33DRAFT_723371 [Rhizoclosmatium globosum]|uniref:Uncharacterized protein n=1 Tax=Rhizoclosmatium globosum TaxID=329046 RepID=A0A1Y2BDY4_9FUNG|nr:hypothetical protein BCR33DRAFT_723371 [Rhizoclosmatium globosum]|eukprot:ORY32707.1 hypothetical protein BCR33DRAFT_723371 [Rhizoclosmatium globosum]